MRARHLRFLILLLSLALGAPCLFSARPAQAQTAADTADAVSPERIRSTWGKALNPSNQVPANGFKAIYFDRRSPRDIVFQETVDSIAIKYAWHDFHNIDSPNFAAYWVGRLSFTAGETKEISVSQSWAKSRIFIDGKIVFDKANTKGSFTYDFTPGEHLIEVEYINNWHTTEYKVTIQDDVSTWTKDDVAAYFRTNGKEPAQVYYAGVYESDTKDSTLSLSLPRAGKPIILWLSSYEAIDWRIAARDDVKAIVLSSYAPGSRVSGVDAGQLIHLERWEGIYSPMAKCDCAAAGIFHCEDRTDLNDVADQLRAVTGSELAGYAMKYSAETLSMRPYDQAIRQQIAARRVANADMQKQCLRKTNPDFDELMLRR